MTKTFTLYSDPGHAWLKVSVKDAIDVGLFPSDFTRYSYTRNESLYLEEDCDASAYLDAAKAKGWTINIREQYSDRSTIRTFVRYQPRVTPAALINAAQRLGKLHLIHISN